MGMLAVRVYILGGPINQKSKMEKTPLRNIIGAPAENAKRGSIREDAMEEFYKLPQQLLARLIRAVPPEAAAATEPKAVREKRNDMENAWDPGSSWRPKEGNSSNNRDQDGDLHDCVYELFFFYLYGWVPRNYELDRSKYLEKLKDLGKDETKKLSAPSGTTDTTRELIAVAWREHFKRELCCVISFILDPQPDIRKGRYGRAAQSEETLESFRPRLIVSQGSGMRKKPARYLCTPVSLGGVFVDAIEILDIIIYNLGRYTGWYHDMGKDQPGRYLKSSERRTGRAEALITLVPKRGKIETLSGNTHQYYSGPLHTVLRENQHDIMMLKRFMNQTKHWWMPHTWTLTLKTKPERIGTTPTSLDELVTMIYPSVPGWERSTTGDELLEIVVGKRRAAKFKRDYEKIVGTPFKVTTEENVRENQINMRRNVTGTRFRELAKGIRIQNFATVSSNNEKLIAHLELTSRDTYRNPVPVIFKKGVFYETIALKTTDAALEAVFSGFNYGSSY